MILTDTTRPDESLNPLRVARGVATALEAENREVNDLGGVRAGRHSEIRSVAHFPLLLPAWPAALDGRTIKKSPGGITDFVTRRYLDRESGLEELMVELYCGNFSVARAEKIVRSLWGGATDITLVSKYGREIEHRVLAWLRRPLAGQYPYVFLQATTLKVGKTGEREWRSAVVAVGVSDAGIREVLAVRLVATPDESVWATLLEELRVRGLASVALFLGENEPALIAAVKRRFPGARYQGDFALMERAVLRELPLGLVPATADALGAARAAISPAEANGKLVTLRARLRDAGHLAAAEQLNFSLPYLHNFSHFPPDHWPQLENRRPFVRVMRDCRELIRLAGADTTPEEILLMLAVRWRRASRGWARRRFL